MSFFSEFFAQLGGAFKWWIVVAPWEQAVRVRGGKHASLLGPGIHFRIPGLDWISRESVRLRTIDLGLQTISTLDGKTVTTSGYIRYKVGNLLKVMNSFHHPEDTLVDEAMGAIADHITVRELADLTPRGVGAAATAALGGTDGCGLTALEVKITDFASVRTYRLLQDDRRWNRGDTFSTSYE